MIWVLLEASLMVAILAVKVGLVLWPIIWTWRAFAWLCRKLWGAFRWLLGYRRPPAYVAAMRGRP